jgi:hypothetical protein
LVACFSKECRRGDKSLEDVSPPLPITEFKLEFEKSPDLKKVGAFSRLPPTIGMGIVEEYWLVKWRKKNHPPEAFTRWKEDPNEMALPWYSVICCDQAQVKHFCDMLAKDLEVLEVKVEKKR